MTRLTERRCFHCKACVIVTDDNGFCHSAPPTVTAQLVEAPSSTVANASCIKTAPGVVESNYPPVNLAHSWCLTGYRRHWRRWVAFPAALKRVEERERIMREADEETARILKLAGAAPV